MKICIVSTYPKTGSMNIGDALITKSVEDIMVDILGKENVSFEVIWRADKWENVKDQVLSSDFVVFACLAIRKQMAKKVYPYISEILSSDKKIGVISAGTSLDINKKGLAILNNVDNTTIELLKKLDNRCEFFTTRGILTQSFCEKIGMKNVVFSGDVAFYDKRFFDRQFSNNANIKKIAISDPHYEFIYKKSWVLGTLASRRSKIFT